MFKKNHNQSLSNEIFYSTSYMVDELPENKSVQSMIDGMLQMLLPHCDCYAVTFVNETKWLGIYLINPRTHLKMYSCSPKYL